MERRDATMHATIALLPRAWRVESPTSWHTETWIRTTDQRQTVSLAVIVDEAVARETATLIAQTPVMLSLLQRLVAYRDEAGSPAYQAILDKAAEIVEAVPPLRRSRDEAKESTRAARPHVAQ